MGKKNVFFAVAVLLAMGQAFALDVQLFQPQLLHRGSLTQFGSDGLHKNEWYAGMMMGLTHNPLEFGLLDQNRSDSLVDYFATLNTQFGFGVTDQFSFLIDVPFNMYSKVESIQTAVTTQDMSMGDLRLQLPFVFQRASQDLGTTGLAFVPMVSFPTGAEEDFFGNASMWKGVSTFGGKMVIDRYLHDRHYIAFNAGVRLRERVNIVDSLILNHEMLAGVGYVWKMSPSKKWDLLVDTYGSTTFRKAFHEERSSPVDVTLAARKSWNGIALISGAGIGFNNGYGSPDWRLFAGLGFFPRDKKVESPAPIAPAVQSQPAITKLALSVVNEKGEAAQADINIKNDLLVEQKHQVLTNPLELTLEDGNYEIVTIASGYMNQLTKVSLEEGKTTALQVTLKPAEKIKVSNRIYFDSGKADLLPVSKKILDEIVKIMNDNPSIQKIRIEAHTDAQGDDAMNLALSQRRADSVHAYMMEKGIDAARLTKQGYGETFLINDGTSPQDHAQNRRVEFLIVE